MMVILSFFSIGLMMNYCSLLKCISVASCLLTASFAQANNQRLDVSNQHTSLQEIAAIQVIGETCPNLIGKNPNFNQGYDLLLAEFLPVSDPKQALRLLNQEKKYQIALKEARSDMAKATREYNREVCLGVIEWKKYQ